MRKGGLVIARARPRFEKVPYRVDNVPLAIKPFWLAWSWVVAVSMWMLVAALHATCKVSVRDGTGGWERRNFIYSLWHRNWGLWAVSLAHAHRRQAWLQHPAAYMKPVHILLKLGGIRVLLGSGGEEGRNAAERLVGLLRRGWSTAISPDGPHGPQGVLKRGVLHVARQSGVPIVPVEFIPSRTFAWPSWDKKPVPMPFSTIVVVLGEPVVVRESDFEAAAARVADGMGRP